MEATRTSPGHTTLRIFVSSTFRDFDLERDALRRVESRLRDRLRPVGTAVTLVDLRWGVFSDADEGARELDVLKVCLEEVERTRPLFLGLLGDRYGWVPDPEAVRAVARRRGLAGDLAHRSVTELEIELGVLASKEDGPGAVFLFRDMLPGPPTALADPRGSAHEHSLAVLKQRIRDTGSPVVDYTVTVNDHDDGYDLGDFETIATEAIWRAIAPTLADTDPGEQADRLQRVLQEELLVGHHDFGPLTARLDERLDAPLDRGLGTFTVVHGLPGGGASTALANAVRHARGRGHAGLFHSFTVGASGGRDELLQRLERLAGRPERPGSFTRRLRDTLATLADHHRVMVLAVDALHDGSDDADACLSWLPDPLPPWLHVVATTDSWPSYAQRDVAHERIGPMPARAAAGVVRARFAALGKSVPEPVVDTLVALGDGSERASASPLWVALATDLLAGLDVDDFARAVSLPGTAQDQLAALVRSTAAELPPTVDGLLGHLLDRTRRSLGAELVDHVVTTVALSWRGVPARALAQVTSHLLGRPVDDLAIAGVRWGLRGQLREVSIDGQLDVAHAPLRRAAVGRADDDEIARRRRILGHAWLEAGDTDPFADREALAMLLLGDDHVATARWFTEADEESLEDGRWLLSQVMAERPDTAAGRVAAILGQDDVSVLVARTVQQALAMATDEALQPERLRSASDAAAIAIEQRVATGGWRSDQELLEWSHELATSLHSRATDALGRGDPHTGQQLFLRAVEVARRLVELDPESVEDLRQLGLVQIGLARNMRRIGRDGGNSGAGETTAAAVDTATRLLDLDRRPGHLTAAALIHRQAGDIADGADRVDDARASYRTAVSLLVETAATDPDVDIDGSLASTTERWAALEARTGHPDFARQLVSDELERLRERLGTDPGDTLLLDHFATHSHLAWELKKDARDERNAGDLLARWHRAVDTLLRTEPANLDHVVALVAVLGARAHHARATGQLEGARALLARGIQSVEAACAADPTRLAFLSALASLLTDAGSIELELGDLDASQRLFDRSLGLIGQLLASDHDRTWIRKDAARAHTLSARIATLRGEPNASWHHARAAVDQRAAIARMTPSTSTVAVVAEARALAAAAAFEVGEHGQATQLAAQAIETAKELVSLEPTVDMRTMLAALVETCAPVVYDDGHGAHDAAALLRSGLAAVDPLLGREPADVDAHGLAIRLRLWLAQLAVELGDLDEADGHCRRTVAEFAAFRQLPDATVATDLDQLDLEIRELVAVCRGWTPA